MGDLGRASARRGGGSVGIGAVRGVVVRCAVAAALTAAAASGCSGGAAGAESFRGDAHQAVEQMVGAVGTAGFAARLAEGDAAFGTYLAALAGDARQAGESARDSAASLRPPPELVPLHDELERLLGDAAAAVDAADDAARTPGRAALAAQRPALDDVARRLAGLEGRLG